jgi:hypothetical protein
MANLRYVVLAFVFKKERKFFFDFQIENHYRTCSFRYRYVAGLPYCVRLLRHCLILV